MKITLEEIVSTGNKDLIDRYFKEDGQQELMKAIEENDIDKVTLFAKNGFDFNISLYYRSQTTPLVYAASNVHKKCKNNIEIINILLDHGANIELKNTHNSLGWGPLKYATYNFSNGSSIEVIKLLIEKGANLNDEKQGSSVLNQIIQKVKTVDDLNLVKYMVAKGADINYIDHFKSNVFDYANCIDYTELCKEIVQFLLEKGAVITDKNMEDLKDYVKEMFITFKNKISEETKKLKEGEILKAIREDKIETVEEILNSGFDVNHVFSNTLSGNTFLAEAIDQWCQSSTDNIDIIKLLLDKGADIEKPSYDWSPLKRAVRKYDRNDNTSKLIRLLIDYGADINNKVGIDNDNFTILMSFCSRIKNNEDIHILQYMIFKGADINYKHNNQGVIHVLNMSYPRDIKLRQDVLNLLLDSGLIVTDEDITNCKQKELKQILIEHKDKTNYKYIVYYGIFSDNKLTVNFPKIIEKEYKTKYFYGYLLTTDENNRTEIPNCDQISVINELIKEYPNIVNPGIYLM